VNAGWSFHCSACGRCCNSPPALTVDELLHHSTRFVGCLAIRRDAGGAVRLATQGHDYPSLGACPARDATGLCAIHDDRKPGMCGVVPLDPRLPQASQVLVLQRRHRESAFLDADCIAPGARAGFEPLVEDERIVDAGYLEAFERYRALLQVDDELWGRDLLEWMRPELARRPSSARPDGYLALSLVPVLAVLARRSADWQGRCARYALQQVTLIEANVARALQRRHAPDRPFTEELRRFASQYRQFLHGP
jgi:hypothetical protein